MHWWSAGNTVNHAYSEVNNRENVSVLYNFTKPLTLLTRNVLPQALVVLIGKVNLMTGGVTVSSRVPLHSGFSDTLLRRSRDSL